MLGGMNSTLSKATRNTTKATEVKSFTPRVEVQETYNSESQIVNNEIDYELTNKDVHSTDYIIDSSLLVAKQVHPILSRLPLVEKFQNCFHAAASYTSMLVS